MKIRQANVAGLFYPADEAELKEKVEAALKNSEKDIEYTSRAVIVPHAGIDYSGELAAKALKYLNPATETIILIAPAHKHELKGLALSESDAWEVPTGNVKINKKITKEISAKFAHYDEEVFVNEHSVEVLLPLIKKMFPKAKFVPVLTGAENYEKVTEIIERYWDNPEISFVISSDLSHFHHKIEANRIDSITADMIENNVTMNMIPEQACGYVGVCGLLTFARRNKFSLMRVGLTDSSVKTGEKSSVVGYGAWYVAEDERINFIQKYFGKSLIDLAKISIKSELEKQSVRVQNYPKALETKVASFVTLEIAGNLRGCVGSVAPVDALLIGVCKNARNAAFKDPRFSPLQTNEFEKTDISVSLLGTPEKLNFESEEDLLGKIDNTTGLIIRDIGRQALFLPEVWEKFNDKKSFLTELKKKAGLAPDWFSDTFEAFTFKTVYVK